VPREIPAIDGSQVLLTQYVDSKDVNPCHWGKRTVRHEGKTASYPFAAPDPKPSLE